MYKQINAKFKIILERILKFFAFLVLKKYHPKIIGITGSVGKTSAKEAIFAVLSSKFDVRRNLKNYNNEIGIPLTIFGLESSNRISVWLYNFVKIIGLIIFPHRYPKILILEAGIDRPGDMKYLTSFIDFKIGVLTSIGPTHLEFFQSIENIAKEKGLMARSLPKDGFAILNRDDERVWQLRDKIKAKIISFGYNQEADLRADLEDLKEGEINLAGNGEKMSGLSFKLNYHGSFVPVRLPDILGKHQVYAALSGAACGAALGMNLVEIAEALRKFTPPPGRMRLLPGIKNSRIIDDTYNASPASTIPALEVLEKLPAKRKIACLGEMLELGTYTEEGHRKVGKKASEIADFLITVGERAEFIDLEAEKQGFPKEKIYHFENSEEAGRFLQNLIQTGDLILAKGSQGSRMEKIVKEIMAEPQKASELLVRQGENWNG